MCSFRSTLSLTRDLGAAVNEQEGAFSSTRACWCPAPNPPGHYNSSYSFFSALFVRFSSSTNCSHSLEDHVDTLPPCKNVIHRPPRSSAHASAPSAFACRHRLPPYSRSLRLEVRRVQAPSRRKALTSKLQSGRQPTLPHIFDSDVNVRGLSSRSKPASSAEEQVNMEEGHRAVCRHAFYI